MKLDHRVSGYDFVRPMLLAGFRLSVSSMGHALLEKNGRRIYAPQTLVMSVGELDMLLRQAGQAAITPEAFVTYLNRLGSRDTVPELSEIEKGHG